MFLKLIFGGDGEELVFDLKQRNVGFKITSKDQWKDNLQNSTMVSGNRPSFKWLIDLEYILELGFWCSLNIFENYEAFFILNSMYGAVYFVLSKDIVFRDNF